MRIIVTGGTGLIGTPLCESLAGDGHEVIVLTRNPDKHRSLTAGIRMQQWDGKTAEGWSELADGAGAIINLASTTAAPTLEPRFFMPLKQLGKSPKCSFSHPQLAIMAHAKTK